MLELTQARERWYSAEAIPDVVYRLNDLVVVLSGPHAKAEGWIVSLEALEPEPLYLVELTSGAGDRVEAQSSLRPAAF